MVVSQERKILLKSFASMFSIASDGFTAKSSSEFDWKIKGNNSGARDF